MRAGGLSIDVDRLLHADPNLVKELGVRQFLAFHDRAPWPLPTANRKIVRAIDALMVQAQGAFWASIRAAAQPLFHSDRREKHYLSL
jgi:hypothetical protein